MKSFSSTYSILFYIGDCLPSLVEHRHQYKYLLKWCWYHHRLWIWCECKNSFNPRTCSFFGCPSSRAPHVRREDEHCQEHRISNCTAAKTIHDITKNTHRGEQIIFHSMIKKNIKIRAHLRVVGASMWNCHSDKMQAQPTWMSRKSYQLANKLLGGV